EQCDAADLSLFIYEEDNKISFRLWSSDGTYNMKPYSEVRLQTPRAYFQEFFRNIENLTSANAQDQLRTQGLNLFQTALPEELRSDLWQMRDRMHTLQI